MSLRFLPAFTLLLFSISGFAQTGRNGVIARGKYLVEQAGQCQDCHSPRNMQGQYIRENWLKGGPILFKPSIPIPNWTEVALPIAGLPGIQEQDAIQLLMTGTDRSGNARRPPMPAYRFSRADATAIVKYLKSLNQRQTTTAKAATRPHAPTR